MIGFSTHVVTLTFCLIDTQSQGHHITRSDWDIVKRSTATGAAAGAAVRACYLLLFDTNKFLHKMMTAARDIKGGLYWFHD